MKETAMTKALVTKTPEQQISEYAKVWARMRMRSYMTQFHSAFQYQEPTVGGTCWRKLAKLMGWAPKAVKEACLQELLKAYRAQRWPRHPREMPVAVARKLLGPTLYRHQATSEWMR
jgi:hypothetical protein